MWNISKCQAGIQLLLLLLLVGRLDAQQRIHIIQYSDQPSLLNAFAGNDITLNGPNAQIGGLPTAVGGTLPYSYLWIPSNGLDNDSIANPQIIENTSSQYTVIVTDSRTCAAVDTILITILGMESNKLNEELLVFPSPGSGSINIRLPENVNAKDVTISIFDMAGRLVIQTKWNNQSNMISLDVSKLVNGSYLLKLNDEQQVFTKRITIQ
jgi:hypothetical protein